MRVLDRKLLREVRGHAGMLLAVTSIIAVGVACLVTLSSSYWNLAEAKRLYYAQCRMADFSIELKKAPLAELTAVAALKEVAEIRPRIQQYVTVDLEEVAGGEGDRPLLPERPSAGNGDRGNGDRPLLPERPSGCCAQKGPVPVSPCAQKGPVPVSPAEPLNGLVLSLPDRPEPIINDILVRRGSYFTDRRDNEVIVSEFFAEYYKLRPGQWIRLLLNNRQQELFIVGTAISSEFVYLLGAGAITPDPKHFGVFYLKQSYAEEVFDFKGSANQVLGRLSAAAGGNPREVLRRAEDMLSAYGVFSTTPLDDQLSNRFLSQEIQGLRSFGLVTPVMFLTVAAMVLNVLLSRLAQQQRTVVGTLKALGYSDGQVFWHFLKFGLAVGLTGGLVGCGLGWWLASGMTIIYRQFFQFPELNNRFYPGVSATAMLVSVGCAVLGSVRGSRAVLRLRPAEAMRPSPPRQGGAVLLERVRWFWRSLTAGWRMVLRNVIRNRMRTIAGVFAAAMGASVLVNGFMMQMSPAYLIDFQFRWIMRSDVDLLLKDERGIEALREASQLPGVDRAEPVLYVSCTFSHGPYRKKGSITGLARDSRLTMPRDLDGRRIRVPASGLAMTRQLADSLHLKRGDLVTVEPVKGQRRTQYVPVVEISESYLGTAVYAEIEYLSRLVGEELAISGVQLATDGRPEHTAALYRELKQMPALQAVTARADMIESIEDTVLRNQRIIIYMLVLFAGIVFFGSILNASLVSLAERQRELATLRVLGYGPWHIGSLLLRESIITTVIGTVLGMPLGYLLTWVVAVAYASDMFRLPVITSTDLWIRTMLYALAFALTTHLFVQRVIHRMDWLDALKVQE